IQSRSFAGLAWRLLLRAYVGTQQIDQALQSMAQLEKVGGDDILQAYTQLGMELQEELKRLQAAGEAERLGQVRTSFEQFLGKVYESRNKTDFNSLLWIGETYYGLGQGVAADPSAAEGYFEKAGNAYSEILQQNLVSADGAPAVQLRLARCRRRQGQFTEALQLVETILTASVMNLDVQFEAAHVLSDWGEKSEPERLKQAILGPPAVGGKPAVVWGWVTLSKRLRQLVTKDPKSEFRPRFFESRYELGSARRRLARVLPDKSAGTAQLKSAMAELASLVQAYRDLDPPTYARFDRLYQDLQADLGESPTPLAQASPANEPEPESEPAAAVAAAVQPAPSAAAAPAAQSAGGLTAVIVSVVGLALAGGLFVMMRRPREKLPLSSSGRTAKISVPVPEVSAAGFPGDLQIEAPPELDFAQLAALPGIGGRTARPASRPAAKPAAGAAAGAGGAAGANSGVPRPRPRPSEGGGGQAPGAGSKPRPAGEVRPGGESRPARPPRPPRPEGDSAGGASG
ncbi:MAG: tetratricopeptide repeat protein, partial [Planctomycetaceae bacterium]